MAAFDGAQGLVAGVQQVFAGASWNGQANHVQACHMLLLLCVLPPLRNAVIKTIINTAEHATELKHHLVPKEVEVNPSGCRPALWTT